MLVKIDRIQFMVIFDMPEKWKNDGKNLEK